MLLNSQSRKKNPTTKIWGAQIFFHYCFTESLLRHFSVITPSPVNFTILYYITVYVLKIYFSFIYKKSKAFFSLPNSFLPP